MSFQELGNTQYTNLKIGPSGPDTTYLRGDNLNDREKHRFQRILRDKGTTPLPGFRYTRTSSNFMEYFKRNPSTRGQNG